MRSLLLACALVCCVALVNAQTPPQFGNQLYLSGVVRLPYAGIIEPFEMWLDGVNGQARVDYYNGLDTYYFRSDLNKTWQVNPQIDTQVCMETPGPVTIRSYLPDYSSFVLQPDAVQLEDQMCDDYQLVVQTLGKTSTYDLFVSRETGEIVRYQMMGYDSLIGSHYDLYQVDYENITSTPVFPPETFAEPSIGCGQWPQYLGRTRFNPLDELSIYYPGNEVKGIVSDDYAAYMAEHGKSYSDNPVELRTRQMHYQRNLHWISFHQRKFRMGQETYSVALNFLADHLPEEMNARRGKLTTPKSRANNAGSYHQRRLSDKDLPDEVDWREKGAVNRPQDQGICGSCWSFGSTGAIEGAYFLKYGVLKVLAEQQLMDCSWGQGNNACDGGEDFRAYDWILQNGGMAFKENYGPYLMQDGYCQVKSVDVVLSSYVNVTEGDENALLDALATIGPMSVSIDASHQGLSFYSTGVYYDPACGNGINDLDHSVSAIGYGTDATTGEDYWLVKNSWSTYWGDGGFIKMSRKNNNCGVATVPTYVIVD